MKNFKNTFSMMIVTGVIVMLVLGCTQANIKAEKSTSAVKITETSEGFEVTEGDKKVLFYCSRAAKLAEELSAAKDSWTKQTFLDILQPFDKNSRPHYIHPLYGLDGEVLTEDFPLDHLHHHGIFWAWHQILIGDKPLGDAWAIQDFCWDVSDIEILSADSKSAGLKIKVFWKSPNWTDEKGKQKPFVKETAIIRIHRASENIRKIDFEISLLALEEGVRIGGSDDKKGYSGFSTRIKLPEGTAFTGQNGPVRPQNTAVEAGPWMDFSGDFGGDGRISGISILCHKSIPGYPRPWILRRRRSMQNAVYPGREPILLSTKEPLVLRYRLIIHRGDVNKVDIDKLQTEYNKEY